MSTAASPITLLALCAACFFSGAAWKTQQHTQQVMAVIHHNLEASGRKDTVLARHPWLVLSPIVHVLLWHTVFGEGAEPDPHYRQAHIDMLCELLA